MAPRTLVLPLVLLLGACRAAPARPAESPRAETPELLRFRVDVDAPADARSVTLTVHWPEDGGHVRFAGATGLVGNALCDLGAGGEVRDAHAHLRALPVTAGAQELRIEASGRVELELRLERHDGGGLSAEDLGRSVAASAQADGRPVEATARFEGVR